jgi:hypothetical protein
LRVWSSIAKLRRTFEQPLNSCPCGGRHQEGLLQAIDWPRAEHIRCAAVALGETYGRDLYVMATAALRAALRNEDDLLELLQPHKPVEPAKAAQPAQLVEIHA